MLTGDGAFYMATLFRGKRTALEKQYEINRTTVSRNMTRFEQAEKIVGHLNMFRPDGEFIAGLAHAWADAMQKGYEIENLLITQAVIDSEIMPGVRKLLTEESDRIMTQEKIRMDALQRDTQQADLDQSVKLRDLQRFLDNVVNETQEAISNAVTLRMIEARSKRRDTASEDRKFEILAIEEARRSVSEPDGKPHPLVGAVVVKDGQVLSVAHRGEVIGNHAEFVALDKKLSDESVAGATVYTTLEPCTTRNPPKIPCVQRIIDRKIARVVVGMFDPDPRITGRGMIALRDANIAIDVFSPDLMTQVEELNREFKRLHDPRIRQQQPLTQEKSARVIAEENRQGLIATLKPFAPRLIDIVKSPDDPEVSELALQISEVLADSGWKPTIAPSSAGERLSGIVVKIDPKNPPNLTAGNVLVSAFSSAGLSVTGPDTSLQTPPTGASVRIVVGRIPSTARLH
jgi:pyrimidine deaminase RibD-like protein